MNLKNITFIEEIDPVRKKDPNEKYEFMRLNSIREKELTCLLYIRMERDLVLILKDHLGVIEYLEQPLEVECFDNVKNRS